MRQYGRGLTRVKVVLLLGSVLLAATGCSPRYVNQQSGEEQGSAYGLSPQVLYQVHEAFHRPAPPQCVAILPLGGAIEPRKRELVRRTLYAHLSPRGFRDVELPRVDHLIERNGLNMEEAADRAALAEQLHCDAMIIGEVSNHGSAFYGVYSKVEVRARLKMVRASDDTLLWEAEHHAQLQDGGLPLSPIAIAAGLFNAARNVDDEQELRVVDDLARRVMNTLPEVMMSLRDDEPLNPLFTAQQTQWDGDLEQYLAGVPAQEQELVLRDLIQNRPISAAHKEQLFQRLTTVSGKARDYRQWGRYRYQQGDYEGALELFTSATEKAPADADAWFQRGRVLIQLDRLQDADHSLVEAIAHNPDRDEYYAALGYINSRRGAVERARASYQMALKHNPENGFAWYNLAVSDYNEGDLREATEHFNNAGVFYLRQLRFDRVEQVLSDLRELQQQRTRSQQLERYIRSLEEGLKQALSQQVAR
jgi:Flp pilus assembly protein TadD